MMTVGTVLVLLFSDPMVAVFSELGVRTGIPAFYISFVLAPVASNASELLASYNYALKKTKRTITISFSALEGAACMNNTFCLAIFLALVFFRGLTWEFSAETIAILVVEALMYLQSMKKTHYTRDAWIVLSYFPASIVLVWALEKTGLN
jgi:Ca2+/Na+ antiporter